MIRGYFGGDYYRWFRSGIYNTYYLDSSYGSGTDATGGNGGGSDAGSGNGGGGTIIIIGDGGGGGSTPCPGGVTVSPDGSVVTCHTN